jgi:hypothetical protein
MFFFSKLKFQNKLIIVQTCFEAALVLWLFCVLWEQLYQSNGPLGIAHRGS